MSELINVLRHNKEMVRIELESKNTNASEFWYSIIADVYNLIPSDKKNTDNKIRDAMISFQETDTLEMVNKQGKLLKRFAKHFKESNGYKLDDKLAGLIGDKLQYYLSKESKVYYADFTDVINWRDGQFGKYDSCWWGQYSDSQEAFISNGGWGIRFYENEEDENGIGRTWIYPKDGMLMCFNSYGVERPNVSKVIKQVYKQSGIILHYKAVELSNSGNIEIPYINSGTGFVLFPEGIDPASLGMYSGMLISKPAADGAREFIQRMNNRKI